MTLFERKLKFATKNDRVREREKQRERERKKAKKERKKERASEFDAKWCGKQATTGWILSSVLPVNVHNSICLVYAKFNGLSCMVPGCRFWGALSLYSVSCTSLTKITPALPNGQPFSPWLSEILIQPAFILDFLEKKHSTRAACTRSTVPSPRCSRFARELLQDTTPQACQGGPHGESVVNPWWISWICPPREPVIIIDWMINILSIQELMRINLLGVWSVWSLVICVKSNYPLAQSMSLGTGFSTERFVSETAALICLAQHREI